MRKATRTRTRTRARRVYRARSKPAVKAKRKGLRKFVKKVIRSQLEVKETVFTVYNDVNVDGAINGPDLRSLALPLTRGTGPGEYIGESVRLKSHVLHLHLRCSPDLTDTNDANSLYIRVMIFTPKAHRNFNGMTASELTDVANSLIRINGAPLAYDGTHYRKILPFNKEDHILHYLRDFRVSQDEIAIDAVGNLLEGAGVNSLASRPWFKYLRIPLKCLGKELAFNGSPVYPTNYNPMVAIGFVNTNNALNPDTATRVNVIGHMVARWTDA